MNGYIAYWNGKRTEIHAESLYAAKLKAISLWNVRKSQQYMIIVVLAEMSTGPVFHVIA